MTFPANKHLKFFELSHTIEHGMITYQGLPGPKISEHWSREFSNQHYRGDTSFQIGKLEMVSNTGTYIDSPFHRYENGDDLSNLNLTSLANLEGIVVRSDYQTGRAINQEKFLGFNLEGKAVLINTNWDKFWGTEQYFSDHPFITRDAAEYIARSGATLVGIDSLNIDDTEDGYRPAHSVLLGENIPIVEHMCRLKFLPEDSFRFFAVPVKVKLIGSFPVRAFAIATI